MLLYTLICEVLITESCKIIFLIVMLMMKIKYTFVVGTIIKQIKEKPIILIKLNFI